MNITDIVIIVLIFLLALIGFSKGFLNALLSFVGTLASFVGAIYLAKPLTALLNNWFGVVEKLGNSLATKFVPFFVEFSEPLTGAEIKANYTTANSFLQKMINLFIKDETIYNSSAELTSTLGNIASSLIVIAVSTIVAFILIKLAIRLLAKLFDSVKKKSSAINGMDRLLGTIVGICKALLTISLVFVIANLLQTVPVVASTLEKVFDGSVVAKPLYDFITNFATKYINSIDFNSIIAGIIK